MIPHTTNYAATWPAAGGLSASCAAQWVAAMGNYIEQFRAALADAGVILAAGVPIIPDGKLHRARAADDKAGQRTAWYRLHADLPISGAGGDWRQGISTRWTAKRQTLMSAAERIELAARILRERAEHQAETERRHKDAAARAARIWASAETASASHPYLVHKNIPAGIARESRAALVLPVQDISGQLCGLQFIDEQGSKRFISGMAKQGHFIPSGGHPDGTRPLWITEGHATAATIQAMRPQVCTIAACDAGNLASVATEARKRWPGLDIVVCPDFDTIGRQKGQGAAEKARAKILPPPATVPHGVSDWNDWANYRRGVTHG